MHPPVDLLSTRVLLVLLHLAVVTGLVLIGYRHFDNIKTGIAAAVLYLMLPYTAEVTGYLRHVLPAAPLVWAIVVYRRPVLAGMLMGLATGLAYYPLFLLPLWLSFYWQRGLLRFLGGLLPMLAALAALLLLSACRARGISYRPRADVRLGHSANGQREFRRVLAAELVGSSLSDSGTRRVRGLVGHDGHLAGEKNLGTLMSCSAAVMLACQFWNAHFGAPLHRLVSAAAALDDLSAKSGRPRGAIRVGRRLAPQAAHALERIETRRLTR